MTGNLGQVEADWWRPVSESSLLLTEAIHEVGAGGSQRCDEHSLFLPIVGKRVLPPSSVATPYLNANVSWPACVGKRH